MSTVPGPLYGLRVLELGGLIAGPFGGQLLGDYGAEVIKIEAPAGDPLRRWGVLHAGESLWWTSIARNKRSVVVDLTTEAGIGVVKRLALAADIVVQNLHPGQLERWGLRYQDLAAENPGLIMVHISGYGRTGPRAADAGFGSIGEAMGGIRHTTGPVDGPSSRTGISLGDSLAAMFAVIGALAAVHERATSGKGQEVDVALYEAVAALMESSLADAEVAGVVRGRSGGVLPGVAPSNAYPAADDAEVLIAANADRVFARLCLAMDQPQLADDPRFATHQARGDNAAELDRLITRWTSQRSSTDVIAAMATHRVPSGRVYTAMDALEDEQYRGRDMILRLMSGSGQLVPMPGVVPRFSRTPGFVRSPGPGLGADTDVVLQTVGGLDGSEIDELRADRVIR
jgi:crotonobetainyl-CoA:carnitine CoA-transferase CaiB-like acyl-CoA transferase